MRSSLLSYPSSQLDRQGQSPVSLSLISSRLQNIVETFVIIFCWPYSNIFHVPLWWWCYSYIHTQDLRTLKNSNESTRSYRRTRKTYLSALQGLALYLVWLSQAKTEWVHCSAGVSHSARGEESNPSRESQMIICFVSYRKFWPDTWILYVRSRNT